MKLVSKKKNATIKNLGLLEGTTSKLKKGDDVCSYEGHDGTGNKCTRIVEHQGINSFHWIMDIGDLEFFTPVHL